MPQLLGLNRGHLVGLCDKGAVTACAKSIPMTAAHALLFLPYGLQITITQIGILESLKPTKFQREQTPSCSLFKYINY